LSYTLGDWYLLRVKLTNDSNFFVREVGQGRGVFAVHSCGMANCVITVNNTICILAHRNMTHIYTIAVTFC